MTGESFRRRFENNPEHKFTGLSLDWEEDAEAWQQVKVYIDSSKSILSENDSPDIPFRYSVNPYRGCVHACAYCYARNTHEFLGLGAGTDFETQIFVKQNAAELLEQHFKSRKWNSVAASDRWIAFSGITDCYQPLEGKLGITRACLEKCLEYRVPVSIITKSALVLRDKELLLELHKAVGVKVTLSIAFMNAEMMKCLEPHASSLPQRWKAMSELSTIGIPTGISLGPMIPGLNDSDIPALLRLAKNCGASYAFYVMLRLPGSVKAVFLERLQKHFPQQCKKVEHFLRETRGGELNEAQFGSRMRGRGVRSDLIASLFSIECKRLGLLGGEANSQVNSKDDSQAKNIGKHTGLDTLATAEFKHKIYKPTSLLPQNKSSQSEQLSLF